MRVRVGKGYNIYIYIFTLYCSKIASRIGRLAGWLGVGESRVLLFVRVIWGGGRFGRFRSVSVCYRSVSVEKIRLPMFCCWLRVLLF